MLLLIAIACSSPGYIPVPDQDLPIDLDAPLVRTDPIDEPQVYGGDIIIEAVIKDPSDMLLAQLVYRAETSVTWYRKRMEVVGGDSVNGYFVQGTILGKDVLSGGMAYYIEAVDGSENENVGCSPAQCEEDPYHFSIVAP